MGNFIKNNRKIFTGSGGSGGSIDPTIVTRLEYLEENEYKISYFTEISASSGTISTPTGATILLDQFFGGIDAYVSTIQNGQPTGIFPTTGGGSQVDVLTFDALGNYTLTGTPSAYPVALIYVLKIQAKDYQNLDTDNILDLEELNVINTPLTTFRSTTGTITTSDTIITAFNKLNGNVALKGVGTILGTVPATTNYMVRTNGTLNTVQADNTIMFDGTSFVINNAGTGNIWGVGGSRNYISAAAVSTNQMVIWLKSSTLSGFGFGDTSFRIGIYHNASSSNSLEYYNASNAVVTRMSQSGLWNFGSSGTATGWVTLAAGLSNVSPLKFNSGTLTTGGNILPGNVEFLTDDYYATITTGTARKTIVLADATLTSGRVAIVTTNGRLTNSAAPAANGTYLTPTSITITDGIITAIS